MASSIGSAAGGGSFFSQVTRSDWKDSHSLSPSSYSTRCFPAPLHHKFSHNTKKAATMRDHCKNRECPSDVCATPACITHKGWPTGRSNLAVMMGYGANKLHRRFLACFRVKLLDSAMVVLGIINPPDADAAAERGIPFREGNPGARIGRAGRLRRGRRHRIVSCQPTQPPKALLRLRVQPFLL